LVTARRGRKSSKQAQVEQATLMGLMKTAVSSIYGIVAIFAGEHWIATDQESDLIAMRLDAALSTLPAKKYVALKSYFENIAPWVALAVAVYAVNADKWERHATLQRERQRSSQTASDVSNNGVAPGQSADFSDEPRLAYPYVVEHPAQ